MKLQTTFLFASMFLLLSTGCTDDANKSNAKQTADNLVSESAEMETMEPVESMKMQENQPEQEAVSQPGSGSGETAEMASGEMSSGEMSSGETEKTEQLKETAREWQEKTGELMEQTWDVTKEKAAETRDASVELYESAKTEVVKVTDTVVVKSGEIYEATREKSAELLEKASDELKKED